ncbi:Dam family site-specific DNA-(adenine-N6)-methyltransferase [Thomasclavelia spiroformis]|uniref:Dam family site-specific DNA-(adenine-N6)-methyltransferase n=1 Tax=Thomasclavelia spiroformis TaxID=29348 RepID=UPI00241F228F|nr:Dam family site-specific DNA-(adenine-N6)-methyltransferase [Thomasclavelia spiroformis]MBS6115918.1 Dam family site-specific DNA-(adenine-N6)-methyltransferase [Thomasclavelia spiroformis]
MDKFELSNRRYLGSKTKLISFIHEVVNKNCSNINSVLDLFGGTGVVGYSFNDECSVLINDILKTNIVAYDTFFSNETIDKNKIEGMLVKYNKVNVTEDNYYSKNFADTYLSKDNMRKVGFIRDDIDKQFKNKKINKREKSILICSLIYGIDKIANTVGHYDAYRKNGNLDQKLIMLMPNINDNNNNNNRIYCENSNQLVKNISADLVYIDPPYNSRQYCDAYHFLENVALNKKPEVFGTARKMDRSNLKSKYCTAKAAIEFADLIENIKAKYILVSYNNTGEKGNARSNAKISDSQIMEILGKKGEVKVFEQEYALFNTGKTKLDDHKERLFLCIVGQKKNEYIVNSISGLVKSPLNYTGGKYKILTQLIDKFPKDIDMFFDIFSGGGNVGVNIEANKIICVDINDRLISLFKYLQNEEYYHLVNHLDSLIDKFSLSNTYKNGYEFYGCNSGNGVGKYNKDKFLNLRSKYNKSNGKRDDLFLLLIIYSFNNQIRFNNKGDFNLPVGKRDFNGSLRKKLQLFMDKLHSKEISFENIDFRRLDVDRISKVNSFLYLDPPYYLGDASYNENGGWTAKDEDDLLNFLKLCDEKQIRFALSNVIEHKGKIHDKLLNWCLSNGFNINYINCSYSNSNYHIKDKSLVTREVLITNY